MDDFFGKEGVFAKLCVSTLEQMLEGELTEDLGYEPYEAAGRNSGNNRNGRYAKKVRTSTGEATVQVPRDRNGEFEPQILARYAGNTNELEAKILAMYARGLSTRDIAGTLAVEWARAGVRVNAVAPGLIASSGLDRYPEAARPMIEQNVRDIPMKRMGTEAEISAAIVFLLSPAAAFISGESMRIDGGGSLWRKT